MKLINDFYTIESTESGEGVYKCKVRLNADHDFYRVHFPGNPVTPGVCLLQMAAEIIGQHYNKTFLLCKGCNIKFKKPVSPLDHPEFVFTKIVMDDGQLSTNISIQDDETLFVKMSLRYNIVD